MPERPPRLLFLNRCYLPDSEATGQLLTELCESLADDFDVHVVCGQPNSPATNDYVAKGIDRRNGVTIHRLTHTRFAKRVPSGRLLNLISFTAATAGYLRRTRFSADVIISETDPFLLPIVAARHSRRLGLKWIAYLQDIYPDVGEAIGKVGSGWLTCRIRRSLQEAYLSAERIIVLGNCMQARLTSMPWSLDTESIRVIPNWADCEDIRPHLLEPNELRMREGISDAFVVMHSGNMGLTQRLDVLVEATQSTHWPDHAILLLVGDGAARPQLMTQVDRLESQRVRFLPYQPRSELATSLSAANLHVVSMHEQITGCLCPSKLYGILAAGRPVLAIADPQTDLVRTIRQHDLGWHCHPGDSEGIAKAVASAATDIDQRIRAGENARRLACDQFDRPKVIEQFREMLNEVLDRRSDVPHQVNCDNLQGQGAN